MQAAPVVIDNYPFRRKLEHGRQLQANTQFVTFQGTVFSNNAQRDPPAMFTYGVITVTDIYNALVIDECEFTDNIYDEDFGVSTKHILLHNCLAVASRFPVLIAWYLCRSELWKPCRCD